MPKFPLPHWMSRSQPRLHVIHRGVYAVGHTRIPQEGRWLAAVFACGDAAVLGYRSAAALWGIRPYSGKPDVIAPHRHRRGALLVARRSPIEPGARTEHRAIPCTTPERTLIDLATVIEPHQVDRAVREAEFLRIVDFGMVERMLESRPRGTKHLRIALHRAAESTAHTRSDLEEFRTDRRRDRELTLSGWLVLRYTWSDIDKRAASAIRTLLSERTPPRSGRLRSAALRA